MQNLKVTSIKYFSTRRGLSYECKTNLKGISIWNDGQGGGTYLNNDNNPNPYKSNDFNHLTESKLEELIDEYEFKYKTQEY